MEHPAVKYITDNSDIAKANDVQAKEAKDHKAKDQQDFIQWMGLKEFAMWYADDQKVDARVIQYLRRRQLWLL